MVKINWNVDYNETVELTARDGEVFHVKKRIPFEQKISMADEYAVLVVSQEPDGFAFETPFGDAMMNYLILKYYTDVELHEDDNIGWIADYFIETELAAAIEEAVGDDLYAAKSMCWDAAHIAVESWRDAHSLKGVLSRYTDDETLAELAKTRELNDELIGLMETARANASANVTAFASFGKKQRNNGNKKN